MKSRFIQLAKIKSMKPFRFHWNLKLLHLRNNEFIMAMLWQFSQRNIKPGHYKNRITLILLWFIKYPSSTDINVNLVVLNHLWYEKTADAWVLEGFIRIHQNLICRQKVLVHDVQVVHLRLSTSRSRALKL